MLRSIPCMVMRGGTSKGLYLLEKDIPATGKVRDRILLRLMGSPDVKQIDGMGGATSVTSKVALVRPSQREDADVDYTFAQVSVDKPVVSYAGNCGNISSGVGAFAIERGLVKAGDPQTVVRVFNTNTAKVMVEVVCTPGGQVSYEGDFLIAGVPGTAAPVKIMVEDPGGTVCDALLPTGNPVDTLDIPGVGQIHASFVDATNPLMFVSAQEIGMKGTELPQETDGDPERLKRLEIIRGFGAKLLGFIQDERESAWKSPGVPKLTIVSRPVDYEKTGGDVIREDEIDLVGRMMSMQKMHPTYAMTGAMCTAVAAVIPGTLVHRCVREGSDRGRLRIGHPGGIIEAGTDFQTEEDGTVKILSAYGFRTCRLLNRGDVYYSDIGLEAEPDQT